MLDEDFRDNGNKFQSEGAATEKTRFPRLNQDRGMVRSMF